MAVLTTLVTVAGIGAPATAKPVKPAAAPPASLGPSVSGVHGVAPKFAPRKDDPASHNFVPQATAWPAATADSVDLTGKAAGTRVRATRSPLTVQTSSAAHPSIVDLHVLDRASAQRARVGGLLFTAIGSSGGAGTLRLSLDYSGFADAIGGNYASRLRLYQLPYCALSTPDRAECQGRTPLRSSNDLAHRTVSADVAIPVGRVSTSDSLAGGDRSFAAVAQPVLLAADSDPGGDGSAGGNYAATDLKPEGTWSAGSSTGGFSYKYPIAVPQAASSLLPELSLNYDSSSIDGQTASTQAQASWVGDGWQTPHSYIEQSFVSCSDDPEGTASPTKTGDSCYNGPILTMSLNGTSNTLVWDAAKQVFKPSTDDGSVVTHLTNTNNGTGTYNTDYWTVTTRNGTVYSFGRNQLPGWVSGKSTTNSVDSIPVFSAHSPNGTTFTDPCYNATWSQSWCTMANRWNLDYVVDVHGNAMAYYYKQDTNFYGRNKGATMTSYVRDSHLDRIDYGFTDGNAYGTVPDRIRFTTGDRCLTGTCQPLNAANKANWPDVPFDLICASGATCTSWSPAFYSTVRLTTITTEQWSTASSQYLPVDTYALSQTIPPTGDGTSPTLWLAFITHTGNDTSALGSASPITLPPTQFSSVQLQNRVDTVTDGLPAFYKYRIQSITTEAGSVITAMYDLPNPCTAPVTLNAATNTSSCYPVRWTPPGYTDPITDWFNKYVVTRVTSTDPTGGAPATVTSYTYLGGAAWHFDDNELVKAKYRSYGQFRGYGKVQVFNGDGVNDRRGMSESTYYRGMSKNNNTTVVNLTDSQGGVHEDLNEFAGMSLESTSYLGEGGPVDKVSISSYWVSAPSATRTRTGLTALTAGFVAPIETYDLQAITGSGPTTWLATQTDSSYDDSITSPTFGLLKYRYKHSTPANGVNDTCAITSYAPVNGTKNIVGLVSQVETLSVPCGGYTQGAKQSAPGSVNTLTAPASVNRPAQVMSAERTFYDDPSWSTSYPQTAAPTKGDATMVRKAVDYTGGAYSFQTTGRSTFDSLGRVTVKYDGNGYPTTTTYTANSVGLVTGISIANPLNQTATSTLDPTRGLTMSATDANGIVTRQWYDALGRLTNVWFHSRPTTSPADTVYIYTIANNGVTSTTTKKLNDSSGYQVSTLLYDAMLRKRQTQAMTPQGGRLISDTFYDSRGWTSATYDGWWDSATTPNTTIVSAANLGRSVPSQTFTTYDGLGRKIEEAKAKDGVVVSTRKTVYNGDRTTVISPEGGLTKTTKTDAAGRTVEIDEYTAAPTLNTPADKFTGIFSVTGGAFTPTTYGYDGHGTQSSVTEPGPHTWTSTFDLMGRVTAKNDPDAGGTTNMSYDGDGNLLESTDSRGRSVSYTYDALSRKTGQYAARYADRAQANQTAKWVYDNSDNAVPGMTYPIGHATTTTAYRGGAAYITQQKNFNVFGLSTGVTYTIPSTEGNLAGTYTFSQIYTATTGLPLKDIYQSQAGLPAETVLHGYTGVFDLPNTLGGLTGYSQGTTYDAWSRALQQTLGAAPNLAYVTNTYDPHTGWLKDRLVTRAVASPTNVDEQAYDYDKSGNVLKQVSTRLGSAATSETQCFTYDQVVQLTAAWTATDGCAVAPTPGSRSMVGDSLGSASAYWTAWNLDTAGNRQSQTQYAVGGGSDITTNYNYNGNGANQPHTLTSTSTTGGGSTSYTYDSAGNMLTRNAGSGSQSLEWDEVGKLTKVTGSTAGTSSYIYDADGNLLIQKSPGTNTLFVGGQELELNTTTQAVAGTRYYVLPGGGSALRKGTGTNYSFALSDQHSTPNLYLDNTAQTPTWRQYTPYGAPRGAGVAAPNNHGFLDKPMDAATGLTIVGARNYDPLIGRFVSVDPILKTDDPQQLNGYAYGRNNPQSNADPSGQMVDPGGGLPTVVYDYVRMPHITAHIYECIVHKGLPNILTKANKTIEDINRRNMLRGWDYSKGSPDEYPFASTHQGGNPAKGSVQGVPVREQYRQGNLMQRFYGKYGLVDGDDFRVDVKNIPENIKAEIDAKYAPPVEEASTVSRWARTGTSWAEEALAGTKPGAILSKTNGILEGAAPALKGLGVVGMVAAVGFTVYDIATAPPEQRVHVAVTEGCALAGGIAGAAIGASLGTAIAGPVGTIVGGAIGGFVGSKVGSAIGEGVCKLFHW